MCETYSLRLCDEPEQRAVAVETPRPALLDDFEARFVVAVKEFVRDLAGRRLIGEFQRLGAVPLNTDHRDQSTWQDAADGCSRL